MTQRSLRQFNAAETRSDLQARDGTVKRIKQGTLFFSSTHLETDAQIALYSILRGKKQIFKLGKRRAGGWAGCVVFPQSHGNRVISTICDDPSRGGDRTNWNEGAED